MRVSPGSRGSPGSTSRPSAQTGAGSPRSMATVSKEWEWCFIRSVHQKVKANWGRPMSPRSIAWRRRTYPSW